MTFFEVLWTVFYQRLKMLGPKKAMDEGANENVSHTVFFYLFV